jgi:cellulose synthase/poly-beta-1,6-N-acetylglucosamine synthase-like glycosyltransferase
MIVATVITASLAIFACNTWILSLLSIKGRRKVPQPPQMSSWPKVSIHLPLYNENGVTTRLLESCVKLDYPRDKLDIVVIDDSDDGTTEVARGFESRYPDIVRVIHRNDRRGFKAGALQTAMQNSKGEFIALFDADYAPPSDFLRKTIPHFYPDDKVAFVQARWTYFDGQFSWIAKAISLAIDIYAFVDQRARYVGNLLAHFSGTCGVFRRQAIEQVGGWNTSSLTEDLDLSIRLYLDGWRYIYLPGLACPGEIPHDFKSLMRQQFRWARGFSECLRKYSPAILRSKQLGAFQKTEALLHLGTYFICPLTVASVVVTLLFWAIFPASFWLEDFWRYAVAWFTLMLSIVIYTAPFIASGVTLREFSRSSVSLLKRFGHLGYLGLVLWGLLLSNSRATIEGLFMKAAYFYRTPKLAPTAKR